MSRERTVRFKYPSAFVKIVQSLSIDINKRNIAGALHLPLSTVYRWTSRNAGVTRFEKGWTQTINEAQALEGLICECERFGFYIRQNLILLIPGVFGNRSQKTVLSNEKRTYNFLSGFKGQIVIGELSFPDGANGCARQSIDVLDLLTQPSSQLKQRLLLAKMEIDQHYYTRLSCLSLAQTIGMSRFSFIRAFRSLFSVSPYRYLNTVRVEHAKHMLALSTHPLELIATSVGFSSASSLARAFKKFAGASPANFVLRIAPGSATQDSLAA